MNRNREQLAEKDNNGMEPTEIDHILAAEDELVPSSGFLASVMERVQEEAAAPAPIPFPWKIAIPGIILAVGVLGWGIFELVRLCLPALSTISLPAPHLSVNLTVSIKDAGWIVMALAISLVTSLLSRRLAGRSGLL